MVKSRKLLKEEPVQITSPTGDDDLSKAIRARDAIKHKVFSLTLEDVIRDPSTVEKISHSIDQIEAALGKIVNKLLDSDQFELADKIDDCVKELVPLWNFLYSVQTAAEKIQESYDNLNFKI